MIPDPLGLYLPFEGYPNICAIVLDNFPQNITYFVKLYPYMAIITENKYHKILPSFIVQPHSTKSWLTVEISAFSWDPLEAPVLQDLFR